MLGKGAGLTVVAGGWGGGGDHGKSRVHLLMAVIQKVHLLMAIIQKVAYY
jgi:hypothetical protein